MRGGGTLARAQTARHSQTRAPPTAQGPHTHANGSNNVVSTKSNAMQLLASYDQVQTATDGQVA